MRRMVNSGLQRLRIDMLDQRQHYLEKGVPAKAAVGLQCTCSLLIIQRIAAARLAQAVEKTGLYLSLMAEDDWAP
jgi:hypothetical protein